MESLEVFFVTFTHYGTLFLELVGSIVLLLAAVRAIINLLRRQEHVGLHFSRGVALALQFKLGAEILSLSLIEESEELLVIGVVIVLHVIITLLIHWEIKQEEAEEKMGISEQPPVI